MGWCWGGGVQYGGGDGGVQCGDGGLQCGGGGDRRGGGGVEGCNPSIAECSCPFVYDPIYEKVDDEANTLSIYWTSHEILLIF